MMGSHEIPLLLTCKSLHLPAPTRDLPGASPRSIRRGGWQLSSRQSFGFRRSVSQNEWRSICQRPNPWLDPYSAEAGPLERTKTICLGAHLYEIESGFLRSVRRRISANSAKTMQPRAVWSGQREGVTGRFRNHKAPGYYRSPRRLKSRT